MFSCDLKEKFALQDKNKSICCYSNYGPCFGAGSILGGGDLDLKDGSGNNNGFVNFPSSYSGNGRKNNQETWTALIGNPKGNQFTALEWEVFLVEFMQWWLQTLFTLFHISLPSLSKIHSLIVSLVLLAFFYDLFLRLISRGVSAVIGMHLSHSAPTYGTNLLIVRPSCAIVLPVLVNLIVVLFKHFAYLGVFTVV